VWATPLLGAGSGGALVARLGAGRRTRRGGLAVEARLEEDGRRGHASSAVAEAVLQGSRGGGWRQSAVGVTMGRGPGEAGMGSCRWLGRDTELEGGAAVVQWRGTTEGGGGDASWRGRRGGRRSWRRSSWTQWRLSSALATMAERWWAAQRVPVAWPSAMDEQRRGRERGGGGSYRESGRGAGCCGFYSARVRASRGCR